MENIEYYDIKELPLVRVYKNLLPKNSEILEILKDSEKNPKKYNIFNAWQKWNDLGTMVTGSLPMFDDKEGPLEDKDGSDNYETSLLREVYNAYYISLKHYSLDHNISEIKTFPDGPSFYKYDHTLPAPTQSSPEFNMNYHTDYAFSLKDNPGKKPITTCTMYFNNDYDGGEMVFNLEPRLSRPYYKRAEQFEEDEPYIVGRVVYTPEPGDVVVFPSGNPDYLSENGFYFHCVNRVMSADKYFCSIFSYYEYEGSEYWKEGLEEYGKDLWIWLEKKRTYNAGFKKKAVSLDD
jgi:hypothetical protein